MCDFEGGRRGREEGERGRKRREGEEGEGMAEEDVKREREDDYLFSY